MCTLLQWHQGVRVGAALPYAIQELPPFLVPLLALLILLLKADGESLRAWLCPKLYPKLRNPVN
jgi:hypothetical protein